MSPDLIAEMARIQHSTRVAESLARVQYAAVDAKPSTTARRHGSVARRVIATAAVALGLGAGVVGTRTVVSTSDVAPKASVQMVEASLSARSAGPAMTSHSR